MIKRIPLSQLRIGMYVHDLECRWLDHPFATNRFEIKSAQDIREIRRIGVRALFIDTDKGLDVQGVSVVTGVEETTEERPAAGPEANKGPSCAPLDRELSRARKVMEEATQVVTGVMEDVRLGKQIQVEKVTPVIEGMVTSLFNNDGALLGLTRIRRMDRYTFEHSVSVAVLLTAFGKHLGMDRDDLVQIGIGGLLHDIGKIKIPLSILNKPGKLTDREFAIMREHVVYSREILEDTPDISDISLDIAAQHHERFDGSGYPEKRAGDNISFFGQMAIIVDVYDALSADRVYKKGASPHAALKHLIAFRNSHFNPELVYSFIHCVGVYPIGTLVELSDGRLAVVLEHTEKGPLVPRVKVIFDVVKRRFVTPRELDLSRQEGKRVEIVGAQDAGKWRITPDSYLDHAMV